MNCEQKGNKVANFTKNHKNFCVFQFFLIFCVKKVYIFL